MKTCSNCQRPLPIERFHRDRTHPDGRKSACKECRNMRPLVAPTPPAPKLPPDPMASAKAIAAKVLQQRHSLEFQRITMHHYRQIVSDLAQSA